MKYGVGSGEKRSFAGVWVYRHVRPPVVGSSWVMSVVVLTNTVLAFVFKPVHLQIHKFLKGPAQEEGIRFFFMGNGRGGCCPIIMARPDSGFAGK